MRRPARARARLLFFRRSARRRPPPRADLIGAMNRVGSSSSGERQEMVGVYFRAGRIPSFAHVPACELTDRVTPLEDLWGKPFERCPQRHTAEGGPAEKRAPIHLSAHRNRLRARLLLHAEPGLFYTFGAPEKERPTGRKIILTSFRLFLGNVSYGITEPMSIGRRRWPLYSRQVPETVVGISL